MEDVRRTFAEYSMSIKGTFPVSKNIAFGATNKLLTLTVSQENVL